MEAGQLCGPDAREPTIQHTGGDIILPYSGQDPGTQPAAAVCRHA